MSGAKCRSYLNCKQNNARRWGEIPAAVFTYRNVHIRLANNIEINFEKNL